MKDFTSAAVAVLALAISIGLGFYWVYPHVEPSSELAGLFVFIAIALRQVVVWGWSLRRKPRPPVDSKGTQ